MFTIPLSVFFICGIIGLIFVNLSLFYHSKERKMANIWETKYHKYDVVFKSLANGEKINKEQLCELSEEECQEAVNFLRNIQKTHKLMSIFSTIGLTMMLISSFICLIVPDWARPK